MAGQRNRLGDGVEMRRQNLTLLERETIITFNESEKHAEIFTYNKAWQKHLEHRLGIKPVRKEEFGGREYLIDKKRIPMPRAPRKLSAATKQKYANNIAEARRKRALIRVGKLAATSKQTKEKLFKSSTYANKEHPTNDPIKKRLARAD